MADELPIMDWLGDNNRQIHNEVYKVDDLKKGIIRNVQVKDGYDCLFSVLERALKQASEGKGNERHAGGLPFDQQPMQQISDLLRSEKGMAFQAIKKIREGIDMGDKNRTVAELLGAINYVAGIVIYLEKQK